jgi:DNA-directed RNA polymerase subunit alpha
MLDFQIPRITAESVEENRGSFTVEPLDRGFGYTFGNSLRRVLLASLAGAAVTSRTSSRRSRASPRTSPTSS